MKCCFVLAALFIFALYCESTNAVEECPEFKPVGCFKDRRRMRNRALGRLLITDRDISSKRYSGRKIDWLNFKDYVDDLACRCANEAKKNGYTHFGLQYYGECWSGPMAGITFAKWGETDKCVNEYFYKCEDPDEESCIGKAGANFVYALPAAEAGPSGSGETPQIII